VRRPTGVERRDQRAGREARLMAGQRHGVSARINRFFRCGCLTCRSPPAHSTLSERFSVRYSRQPTASPGHWKWQDARGRAVQTYAAVGPNAISEAIRARRKEPPVVISTTISGHASSHNRQLSTGDAFWCAASRSACASAR
jgi:hypothetical protein